MRFIATIGQRWGNKWQRTASVSLTIVTLSAVAVAVFACFGSEVLAAWKTPGAAEQALASGGTFEGLLNFEAPAQTVARLKTQTEDAKRSHARALLVVEVKNWKDTSLFTTLIQVFKAAIDGFLNPPFVVFKPTPFSPLPAAFTPAPFTGDIHSPNQVAIYDALQTAALLVDRTGDYAQLPLYLVGESAAYNLASVANVGLATVYIATVTGAAAKAAAAALAIPFIGPVVAGAIWGIALAGDAYIAANFLKVTNKNATTLNTVGPNAQNALNKHLAGDVFTPLAPATPYH